jgi:hypothetical protein
MLTAKKGVMESPDATTTGTFMHILRHGPSERKTWLNKLDKLAGTATGMGRQFYVVEMTELLDTRYVELSNHDLESNNADITLKESLCCFRDYLDFMYFGGCSLRLLST